MSNSSLVSYTRLSPNNSGARTHKIDRITPHCVVGQLSVESLGSIFAPTSRQASSNYGIGADGRVGMYVEEKNRSWCSSSNANDQRAVTIECASDLTAPYAFKTVVYNKLVDLCVDICKRNGKTKLLFLGSLAKTEAHSVKSNEMLLTAHRWFASTACPGDWMYSRLDDLASAVTSKLSGSKENTSTATKPTTSTLPDVTYKVKTKKHGWLSAVKNTEDYAGYENSPIIGLAMKVSKGSVKYRVHVKGSSWLPFVTGYDTKDDDNGYAGNNKEIDCIQIVYTAPSGKSYQVKYRVAPIGGNYYDWQRGKETTDGQDGYAGAKGRSIGKVQITLVKK